ncbi:glucokinase [Kordiimonas sediminis]|uniref:Glucokinase n=1 Tax=Kordiimonas sediminis TaxID=1735581 RepID=A0A919AL16_9PROT|nr:glucokinase [Kordiimonas sediminis]GHF13409.1 glucokinase [Kordiimonas sediminis]
MSSRTIIVGDIGGTNGRLALADIHEDTQTIQTMYTYQCADYAGLTPMLQDFIADTGANNITGAQLAIAGPTGSRSGMITNLGWTVDAAMMEQELGFQNILFMNDFAALATAASSLTDSQTLTVKEGTADPRGPISVLGPGTGFGVALLVPTEQAWHVVPTEGGHVTFSPVTELEQSLYNHLKQTVGHVSVELLLSGSGLTQIHQFLLSRNGEVPRDLSPADITSAALNGTDASCVQAVEVFLSALGSVAGDIALTHGATGGVFLGGGILPKITPFLERSDFADRFMAKGHLHEYLQTIPVRLITAGDVALIGAAIAA